MMEWIDINNRIPSGKSNVLIACADKHVCEAVFDLYTGCFFDPVEEWEKYRDVTHWANMPEPPEDK